MSKKAVCTKAMSHKPSSRVDPLLTGSEVSEWSEVKWVSEWSESKMVL